MLIVYFNNDEDGGWSHSWHIGEDGPRVINRYGAEATEVYADGDELEHIRANWDNLRGRRDTRAVTYYGDDAKSIAGNL